MYGKLNSKIKTYKLGEKKNLIFGSNYLVVLFFYRFILKLQDSCQVKSGTFYHSDNIWIFLTMLIFSIKSLMPCSKRNTPGNVRERGKVWWYFAKRGFYWLDWGNSNVLTVWDSAGSEKKREYFINFYKTIKWLNVSFDHWLNNITIYCIFLMILLCRKH